ncbi:MAG: hypothetical protein IKW90_03535, partial [Lachnospiraceae bacterium]|nr:hypothetical protein [Lachnospiraceae bacterium]
MRNQKQISRQTNETKRKRGPRSVHIFDSVFRVMCERLPRLLIPLINEIFGTSYPMDAEIIQLKNEHHIVDDKIVTDAYVKINGDAYHLECQSTDMQIMITRMFEYDLAIALEEKRKTEHGYEVELPRSCVVYLRGRKGDHRLSNLRIKFPDGTFHDYKFKVSEVEAYSREDMFEKNLLMFLPFYILRFEKKLPTGRRKDKKELQDFLDEFEKIREGLDASPECKDPEYYVKLVELIIKVSDYVCGTKMKAKKEVREIMRGKTLVLESDIMKEKARQEGRQEGR